MSDTTLIKVIRPPRGWWSINWAEIWRYRELLFFLAWRDVKVRYKQTTLGILWAFIQPFVQLVIFSIVFGRFAKMNSDGLPYPVFAYAGLLPWHFFAETLNRSSGSVLGSTSLITKVYFPRLIIPIAASVSCCVDFLIAIGILVGLMVYYGIFPGFGILAVPLLIVLTLMPALGAGILLSALTVMFRDVKYVVPFAVQAWFFATPVVYSVSVVPARYRWVFMLNPMSGVVSAYRAALLGTSFHWTYAALTLVLGIVLLAWGLFLFRRMERYFADVI